MTTETTNVETTVAETTVAETKAPTKKRTVKKAAPKAPAKKTTKKAVKKAPKPASDQPAEYGIERSHDLPWHAKKVAIFKALRALKAVGATTARSANVIAEKADVTARDVRHYCYHAKAAGLVDVAEIEDVRGYSFFLTAKGAKVNPVAEAKAAKTE